MSLERLAGRLFRRRSFRALLAAGVLLVGCVYVGCRWSPSSYAIVLQAFGVADTGLVWGTPRSERGDEFSWHTPLLQMALHSEFDRFDHTPPYFEDLRSLYALPINDWGLLFKPQLWAFRVVPPAFAYSFYHFILIAMFVVGFTLLLMRLGGGEVESLLMAFVLFFAAYTQYWWNGSANYLFPFFPWIVLALLWEIRFSLRVLLFYYLLVCGLLTYFYPPNAIALGFVGVTLLAVAAPETFRIRRLVPIALAAAGAVGTAVLYLHEAIAKVGDTVYPGNRIVGGGGLGFPIWLSQFLPTSQQQEHTSLLGVNICEASTLGSIYLVAVACFVPWRRLLQGDLPGGRWRLALLAAATCASQAWMTLPLPAWLGYPFLWHRAPPGRMILAGGLLLLITAFLLAHKFPLRFTGVRLGIFASIVFLGWWRFKWSHGLGLRACWRDWGIVVPVLLIALLRRRGRLSDRASHVALLGASALMAVVSFGTFNPIQSTEPIFAQPRTAVTEDLDRKLRQDGRGFLLLPWGSSPFAHSGLPLTALGYPSLAFATFAPAMDLWRELFPELPEKQLREVFDNVGVFAVGDVDHPQRLPGTLVTLVPQSAFSGLTVCDLITDSRKEFRAAIGCGDRRSIRVREPVHKDIVAPRQDLATRRYTATPCRRVRSTPIPAQNNLFVPLAGGDCAIPGGARAVSISVTVAKATAPGFLRLFVPYASVSEASMVTFDVGQTRVNGVIVAVPGSDATLGVFNGQLTASVNVILDVNGYFQ